MTDFNTETTDRSARVSFGWTVRRVALLAGCLPSDVLQYEAGARFIDRPYVLDAIYSGLRGIVQSQAPADARR